MPVGVKQVAIATESAFGTKPAASAHYGVAPFDKEPSARPSNPIALDNQVRDNVGPAGNVVGIQEPGEVAFKLWAHGSGEAATGDPDPFSWEYLNILFGATPYIGSNTETWGAENSTLSWNNASLTLKVTGGDYTNYNPGQCVVIKTDENASPVFAFIVSSTENTGDADLVLDRSIGVTATFTNTDSDLYGGYSWKCDTSLTTTLGSTLDSLESMAITEELLDGSVTNEFTGAVVSGFTIEQEDSRVNWNFTATNSKTVEGSAVSLDSGKEWTQPLPFIQSKCWDIAINGSTDASLTSVGNVMFDAQIEVAPIGDVKSCEGRSGMVCNSMQPMLTLTIAADSTMAALWRSRWEDQTAFAIGVVFSSAATPTAGQNFALYMPNAYVVTDPGSVAVGDVNTLEIQIMAAKDTSTAAASQLINKGNFVFSMG